MLLVGLSFGETFLSRITNALIHCAAKDKDLFREVYGLAVNQCNLPCCARRWFNGVSNAPSGLEPAHLTQGVNMLDFRDGACPKGSVDNQASTTIAVVLKTRPLVRNVKALEAFSRY